MYHCMVTPMLSICSSFGRHLGCVHILAVLKDDVFDIYTQVSVWTCVSIFLEYIPTSGIVGSYDYSEELQGIFHSS